MREYSDKYYRKIVSDKVLESCGNVATVREFVSHRGIPSLAGVTILSNHGFLYLVKKTNLQLYHKRGLYYSTATVYYNCTDTEQIELKGCDIINSKKYDLTFGMEDFVISLPVRLIINKAHKDSIALEGYARSKGYDSINEVKSTNRLLKRFDVSVPSMKVVLGTELSRLGCNEYRICKICNNLLRKKQDIKFFKDKKYENF